MNIKTTALCIALVPALALLASCHDSDDVTPPAAATAPMDSTSSTPAAAQTMPADNMSSGTMAGADAMTGAEMSFADMDKNHDGSVSKDELTSTDMLYQHFAVADADANGMLSDAEIAKHRADMATTQAQ